MEYFKFLGEITDIGLRISFKASLLDGSIFFRHWRPNDVKEIQVLKFEPVMLGRKWGGPWYRIL